MTRPSDNTGTSRPRTLGCSAGGGGNGGSSDEESADELLDQLMFRLENQGLSDVTRYCHSDVNAASRDQGEMGS